MGDRTDFDVGNYNDEELLAIMDLLGNTDHHVPLTKDMSIFNSLANFLAFGVI